MLAFFNHAGGCGTTSLTRDLGYVLAESGRVLLLDCDPQANLTQGLGVADQYDYVLLDCPPALGQLAASASIAATRVVVPVGEKAKEQTDCVAVALLRVGRQVAIRHELLEKMRGDRIVSARPTRAQARLSPCWNHALSTLADVRSELRDHRSAMCSKKPSISVAVASLRETLRCYM
ncbi:MAG: ParA family protein [Candidatus Schekmanbacteria bacterium]|nr:ParA family protein [Candidatus Schekmanbacteria bacterium]